MQSYWSKLNLSLQEIYRKYYFHLETTLTNILFLSMESQNHQFSSWNKMSRATIFVRIRPLENSTRSNKHVYVRVFNIESNLETIIATRISLAPIILALKHLPNTFTSVNVDFPVVRINRSSYARVKATIRQNKRVKSPWKKRRASSRVTILDKPVRLNLFHQRHTHTHIRFN